MSPLSLVLAVALSQSQLPKSDMLQHEPTQIIVDAPLARLTDDGHLVAAATDASGLRIQPVGPGFQATEDGCFLDSVSCISIARQKEACELEEKELKRVLMPIWAIYAAAGVGMLLGGSIVVGIDLAQHRR